MTDTINPEHYTKHKIQPVDVVEDWDLGFHLGNVIKYISRYKDKGGLEDLKKADWYLDRFIEMQTGHKQDINETNKTPNWDCCVIQTTPGVVVKPLQNETEWRLYNGEDKLNNYITIPNKDFTAASQHKYNPIRYKGDLYEYTYTMGDDVYYTRVSGQSEGAGDAASNDNGAGSASVDGMGR